MALSDHFRELRARLVRSIFALLVGIILGLVFYNQLLDIVTHPYYDAQRQLAGEVQSQLTVSGVGGPLMVQLKLATLASVVGTSPFWLYQIWGFILPALKDHERKWSRIFMAVAGPLFICGAGVGFYILPKGLEVLIGFTNADMTNLVDFREFLTFLTQMLLVFGISFEIPVFVLMLNAVGLVRGKSLAKHRPWIIIAVFVFAAVATPSTDPFSMCFLAIPMVILFGISEFIARLMDRRRDREAAAKELTIDQASEI